MNGYGVLRGSPDRWVREDGDTTPHLQIRLLDRTRQPWRIAVNVQSDTGAEVGSLSQQEFAELVRSEITKWKAIASAAGVKPE